MNEFIKETTMGAGANGACTENGAISYSTTGSELINQFSKSGTARGRNISEVWIEQAKIWGENPIYALRFPFYLRMITRQCNYLDNDSKSEKVQKGQGCRDEAFKRLLWIANYHPEEFYRNLWVLPIVGSWKDLWVLLAMDDGLDKNKFFQVFAEGINSKSHKDLVKKYMPRIRSNKKCTTEWAKKTNSLAKQFANYAGWSLKDYREFKTTGKAHEFQQKICAGRYDELNWNLIPGKALLNLVNGKFLEKHNLQDNYVEWVKKQPLAKFNGYVYELGMQLPKRNTHIPLSKKLTIDRQFDNLIATAEHDGAAIDGNVLVALDTSGSMAVPIHGTNGRISSFDVCLSLGLYFSELNKGAFHNVVAMFDSISTLKELKSKTFTEKWLEITQDNIAWGSTNFQSVIDLLINTRKNNPDIPLEDFPQTILVISDMQFNNCGNQTNYQAMMSKLSKVFPSDWVDNFKCIWWYCAGRDGSSNDVPATMDMGGQYLFSGFDGAVISLLLSGEQTDTTKKETKSPSMEDIVHAALEQEALQLIN